MYRKKLNKLKEFSVYRGEYEAKMDQNETPFNLPDTIKDEIVERFYKVDLNRYTDLEEFNKLKKKISRYAGVEKKKIAIGAGADTLIHTLIEVFGINNGKVLSFKPSYPIYNIFSIINGVDTVQSELLPDTFSIDRDDFLQKIENVKIIFITYPNNPTGNLFDQKFLLKTIKNNQDKIFVIDEAYYEFAKKSFVNYMDKFKNIIILRTFSKYFSVPSMRIGYMISSPEYVELVEKCQFMPYNVSLMSLITAGVLLNNNSLLTKNRDFIVNERERLYNEIQKMDSFNPCSSETNFIFIKETNNKNISKCLYRNKIFVRDFSQNEGLEGYFRITVSTRKENNLLLKKLKEWNRKKMGDV